jgi:hypothetical protein
MTGLERLIQKVSNATAQAMMGSRPAVVSVESWSLDELRRAALEDEERRIEKMTRMSRMIRTCLD